MRPPSSSNAGGPHVRAQETAGDFIARPREGGDKIQFSGSDDYLLPDSLIRILSDPGVLLVGVGIGGDVSRLEMEYPQLRQRGVKGVVCLSEMAKRKVTICAPVQPGDIERDQNEEVQGCCCSVTLSCHRQ